MGDGTKISWADATWNMIRARNRKTNKMGWHCEHVTEACRFCYAEVQNMRRGDSGGTGLPYKPGHMKDLEIILSEKALTQPLRWREPRRIFPCSMTDLFGNWVPDAWLDRIFAVMGMATQHTFEVLTKRPDRMQRYLSDPETMGRIWKVMFTELAHRMPKDFAATVKFPFPNIWVGTSICDQANAEEFVPYLLGTPAALHFVSAAPLLGLIDLSNLKMTEEQGQIMWPGVGRPRHRNICDDRYNALLVRPNKIGWVLTEGESGQQARPTDPEWFRVLRDQCAAYSVPFHHKQNGEFAQRDVPKAEWKAPGGDMQLIALNGDVATVLKRVGLRQAGRELDGVTHDAFPVVA